MIIIFNSVKVLSNGFLVSPSNYHFFVLLIVFTNAINPGRRRYYLTLKVDARVRVGAGARVGLLPGGPGGRSGLVLGDACIRDS
jgi:hypothetical protein